MIQFLAFAIPALAAPATAQTTALPTPVPAPMAVEAVDPARLAAAERLLGVLMPPARFEAMIDGITAATARNVMQQFRSSALATTFSDDPRVQPIMARYIERLTTDSVAAMRAGRPDMMRAMQRAYARRFTVAQLTEVERFFATPTGQLYMDQGATIMADPDVAAWQQKMVKQQFDRMPEAMRAMTAELTALPEQPRR